MMGPPMSEDWNTKYGTRRVRRDPPTLDEAIFAAIGITDDLEAQAEIAASLMGMPLEAVLAEVKKIARVFVALRDAGDRRRTRRAAFDRGRTPGHPEIRQRQAHRHLRPTRPASGPEKISVRSGRSWPQPDIRSHIRQYARLRLHHRACGVDRGWNCRRCRFRLFLRRQVDTSGGFAMSETSGGRRTCGLTPASPRSAHPW